MTLPLSRLLEEALQLPPETRATLVASLLESLNEKPDVDVEAAWDQEIARRVKELDSATMSPIPWSQARRSIAGS